MKDSSSGSSFMLVCNRIVVMMVICLVCTGCNQIVDNSGADVTRTTLENGITLIHYSKLPVEADTLAGDLFIGVAEGEDAYMFGDIRGIEADNDGNVYVFDYQATDIRVFDNQGIYLKTIATKGPGPAEITEANGMVLKGDSILWVHDYRQNQIKGFSKHGKLLDAFPPHVRSYGYIFSGVIDDNGLYWKSSSRGNSPRQAQPDEGLLESSGEAVIISLNPKTLLQDTLSMGRFSGASYVAKIDRGFSFYGIPFRSGNVSVVHPKGGFWRGINDTYEIVRLNSEGDSLFVIKVEMDTRQVTVEDERTFKEGMIARSPDLGVIAEEIAALMPSHKPLIQDLIVDDEGRLWVQHQSDAGEPVRYDVFDDNGVFLKSLVLGFGVAPYFPIRHRNGRVYGLNLDSLSVPIVVRSEQFAF